MSNDLKVIEFDAPAKVSTHQYLRIALVKKDYQEVSRLIDELTRKKQTVDAAMESRVNTIAYSVINSAIKIGIEFGSYGGRTVKIERLCRKSGLMINPRGNKRAALRLCGFARNNKPIIYRYGCQVSFNCR